MRKLFAGLVGVALATLTTTLAVAQPVVQNTFTGNECWSVGQGPGGPSSFVCGSGFRNGTGIQVVTGSGAATTAATANSSLYLWHTPAPTTWALTLPNPANDGQIVQLATDVTLTTNVTVTALNTPQNQTLSAAYASQTITANTSGPAWAFSLSLLQWTRIK
jgi:hypothetical protein